MIDIVVTNYKTPGDLRNFLASLHCVTLPFTLTVVDVQPDAGDSSTSVEQLDRITGPMGINYERHLMNIGYARACNAGARVGSNDAIAFFNADVAILPGSIERCYETLMSDSRIAVVGPKQVDRARRLTHAGIVREGRAGAKPRAFHHLDRGRFDWAEDVVSVSGSAYFTKRAIWDEMTTCPIYQVVDPNSEGGFLQTQHYFEETWYSYHVAAHGYRVVYEGRAKMIHLWHRASPRGGKADRMMSISEAFFRKACDRHGIECRS